jgi:rod shape-determining protein MreC
MRFFLLSIACLSLMVLDHRQSHLMRIRDGLAVVVYPIRALVDLPFYAWRWAGRSLTERGKLLDENDRLRRDQLDLNVRLQRLAALEAENARLRAMMDASARVADRVLVAEILSVDLDPYRHRFAINKGLSDDVYVGQALLDANGVVGQIVRAEPLMAEAVLISDADHALPVTVNRSGLRTIAVGTGEPNRLSLPYLTNNADIQPGDLLVSSGLGGAFPAGYPVGTVVSVDRRPGQPFALVSAEPAAALARAQEVLLIWKDEPNARDDSAPSLADAQ